MNAHKDCEMKSKCRQTKPKRYRKFPYVRVAEMWGNGMTIGRIARATKRVDKGNANGDLYHSLRNFLYWILIVPRCSDEKSVRAPDTTTRNNPLRRNDANRTYRQSG